MKIIILLFGALVILLAARESKIVLVTYSKQHLAVKNFKAFIASHRALLQRTHTTTPIDIGVFQSQQYYFIALKPFATRHAAQKLLQQLHPYYPSAYISSYPNSVNHLMMSQPLVVSEPSMTLQPTKTPPIDQDNNTSAIRLEQEFLKPLSIEEIIHTTTSNNTAVQPDRIQPSKSTPKNFQPILYFGYMFITMLIVLIIILIVKNHRLKGRLGYQQALLNARNILHDDAKEKKIPIHAVDLARYIQTALSRAMKEQPELLALKPVQQIQTCINDIIIIDSFMHGEVYIKNREFPLRYLTEDLAKRYQLTFEVSSTLPDTLIGSVETIEHIFLRLSYVNTQTITIESRTQSDEHMVLQFSITYDGVENHAIDYAIIKEFILSVGGTLTPNLEHYDSRTISVFTLPFLLTDKNSLKINRP